MVLVSEEDEKIDLQGEIAGTGETASWLPPEQSVLNRWLRGGGGGSGGGGGGCGGGWGGGGCGGGGEGGGGKDSCG